MLGAALYAANLSTTFRLRKCGMTDGVTHPVTYQVQAAQDSCPLSCTVTFAQRLLLKLAPRELYPPKRCKPHAAQLGWPLHLLYACVRSGCQFIHLNMCRWHLLSV